jgi:hypothetical protein
VAADPDEWEVWPADEIGDDGYTYYVNRGMRRKP